ncbi:peptidoglycan DD-metalloendopeptidase family protein [Nocardia sp. NEAU-G5]|uniref:Peptidoglycan DD-metalloendopeptidase family protein n=1 Tax=Nocardia albiluteola TaxID=2842303 RepID=A0ABS6AYK4_9NOCA|nr:peptidoglycan DD-metalloendopeptidase family protein [Nocardia albiluteola]MBU3063122.1 peptidoglycan DD-metalloendopeptidase family protein [Nocardia albiluteola]
MSAVVLTALYRYRYLILGVVLVLLLLIAQCSAPDSGTACGASVSATASGLAYPVDPSTSISSGYRTPDRPDHEGVDFAVPQGSPIHALADGTVTAAQDSGVQGFGGWVVISHAIDGKPMSSVYGHINPGGLHVHVGQQVRAGDFIADSGNAGESSGPHLHFELWNGDRLRGGTVTDPTPLLNRIKSGTANGGTQDAATSSGSDQSRIDRHAWEIIQAGRADGVPDEAIVLALSVGLVESEMHNYASTAVPESTQYPNDGIAPGDADSVGILQQRSSQGWGTVKDLMNVQYQASNFYRRLMAGDWQHKSFTDAAADVERPREDLRWKYGARQAEAQALFARLTGHPPTGGQCGTTPGAPSPSGGGGQAIVAAARSQFGRPYVWGGGNETGPTGSPAGFDCSGLALYAVHAGTGIALPHNTNSQIQQGQIVSFTPATEEKKEPDLGEAEPGDIVFFGTGTDTEHEGIYTGTLQGVPMMVHAPDRGQSVVEAPVADGGNLVGVRRYATQKSNSAVAQTNPEQTATPSGKQ